jgi:hypothetical protein
MRSMLMLSVRPFIPVSCRASSRHTTLSQQLSSFESSLSELQRAQSSLDSRSLESSARLASNTEQLLAAMESRLKTEAHESEARNTSMYERHATTIDKMSGTIQMLQGDVDRRADDGLLAQLRNEVDALARECEARNTSMHERHATTIDKMAGTIQLLQGAVDRRADGGLLAQLRGEVDELARNIDEQARSVSSLSSLSSLSTLPKQVASLSSAAESTAQSLEQMQQQHVLETATSSAILNGLAERIDHGSKALAAHVAAWETQSATNTTRFRHIEEAIRSTPSPDATLVPKVNNLYVQVDRLEQTVEVMAKSGNKKTQQISKPQTPVNTEAEEKSVAIH